ncbi:uncharacterized protein LDX57_001114 [Aspergillus melleus]|uniref:uncharacterized protein n=1 Tax=Aspergillus melleus TaxID=138277 RepID=UPI001E8EBDA4|nr:uncharacterized protein LDX57_001114 [Aspergillus melleus]KAH8423356.1 hypothetical protein LDX57_001114 [Aspergillus melleus]
MTPVTTTGTTSAFAGSDNNTDHRPAPLASHSNVAATIVPIHCLGDDLAADAMTDALPPGDPPSTKTVTATATATTPHAAVQDTSTKAKASVDDIATAVDVATTTTVTVIVTSAQTKPKTKSKPRSRSKRKAKTQNKPNDRRFTITIALPPLQLASALGVPSTDHLLLLGDVAVAAMIVTMTAITNTTGIVPLALIPHPLLLGLARSLMFTLIGIRCTAPPRRLL